MFEQCLRKVVQFLDMRCLELTKISMQVIMTTVGNVFTGICLFLGAR